VSEALFAASVPVFAHYLGRAAGIVARAGDRLDAQIGGAFPAGQQFATAAGFALRVACPLAGRAVPVLDGAVAERIARAQDVLAGLTPADFSGAGTRLIVHRAGFADLHQTGADFLHLFGLPNFFFHLTMGYAALRAAGMPLGKADFDGFHTYPPRFAFPG